MPEIDTTKAAFIAAQEARLSALGFALPPPLFALGTTLAREGLDTYRGMYAEWADRPLFADSLRAVISRIKAEKRRDVLVNIKTLRMTPEGFLRRSGGAPVPIEYGGQTLERILGAVSSALPGASRCLPTLDPDIRASVWNRHIPRLHQDVFLKLGLRQNPEGNWGIYRAVSTRYPEDGGADVILSHLLEGLPAKILRTLRGSIIYDSNATVVSFDAAVTADPIVLDPKVGDAFRFGLRGVTADGATWGAVEIKPFVGRIRCINCTTSEAYGTSLKLVHRGSLAAKLREGIPPVIEAMSNAGALLLDDWRKLREIPAVGSPLFSALDIPRTEAEKYESITDVLDALVAHKVVNGVGPDALRAAYMREPGESWADVLNAVTRAAHESPLNNLSRWQAEQDAAAMLPALARAARAPASAFSLN